MDLALPSTLKKESIMCTFTIVKNNQNRVILTSSRDEQDTRKPSLLPEVHLFDDKKLFYAKDADAGGTWLGINENARVICLLNGAFVLHVRKLPYKHSRGFVVLNALNASTFEAYVGQNFEGIEPFTLVCLENMRLQEFRWDGEQKHHRILNIDEPQIWSSATLYTPEVAAKRKGWFSDWCHTHARTAEQMLAFHSPNPQHKQAADEAIFMRRAGGGTVSLTSLDLGHEEAYIKHHNFVTNGRTEGLLNFPSMQFSGSGH